MFASRTLDDCKQLHVGTTTGATERLDAKSAQGAAEVAATAAAGSERASGSTERTLGYPVRSVSELPGIPPRQSDLQPVEV